MDSHQREVAAGERFEFGANWARFLTLLDESRIALAEQSVRELLGVADLRGRRFLDVGSGSGLFSLSARRLGATVHSFDYDPQSVACTLELRRRYFPNDPEWTVEQGSVLETDYLATLGRWDVVYSWGVLHHTGAMWRAMKNVAALVAPGGSLAVAIYNDQGSASRMWLRVKRAYNRLRGPLRLLVLGPAALRLWGPSMIRDVLGGHPLATWRAYAQSGRRGMSPWRDVIDWVGGLPFEVATPEQVFTFFRERGFALSHLRTCGGGIGCNEFAFRAAPAAPVVAADSALRPSNAS